MIRWEQTKEDSFPEVKEVSKPDHFANGSSSIQMNGIRVRKEKRAESLIG